MSFGKMRSHLTITMPGISRDTAGFGSASEILVAQVRGYHEARHANRAWVNRAAHSKATDLFRLRTLPGIVVLPGMIITHQGTRFEVVSVEDVATRGRYLEVLTTRTTPEAGRGNTNALVEGDTGG